jgi:hypothetical protein
MPVAEVARMRILLFLLACSDGALPTPTDMGGTLCPFAPVTVCNCCCYEPNPPRVCVGRGQTLESLSGPPLSQCPPNAGCTQMVVYECCD